MPLAVSAFALAVMLLSCCHPARYQSTAFFYAGITTETPGGGSFTITRTPEINGTLYAFFGMEDASIPPEQVDQIEAELKYQGHRVFVTMEHFFSAIIALAIILKPQPMLGST